MTFSRAKQVFKLTNNDFKGISVNRNKLLAQDVEVIAKRVYNNITNKKKRQARLDKLRELIKKRKITIYISRNFNILSCLREDFKNFLSGNLDLFNDFVNMYEEMDKLKIQYIISDIDDYNGVCELLQKEFSKFLNESSLHANILFELDKVLTKKYLDKSFISELTGIELYDISSNMDNIYIKHIVRNTTAYKDYVSILIHNFANVMPDEADIEKKEIFINLTKCVKDALIFDFVKKYIEKKYTYDKLKLNLKLNLILQNLSKSWPEHFDDVEYIFNDIKLFCDDINDINKKCINVYDSILEIDIRYKLLKIHMNRHIQILDNLYDEIAKRYCDKKIMELCNMADDEYAHFKKILPIIKVKFDDVIASIINIKSYQIMKYFFDLINGSKYNRLFSMNNEKYFTEYDEFVRNIFFINIEKYKKLKKVKKKLLF
jgi:hypothetical protein